MIVRAPQVVSCILEKIEGSIIDASLIVGRSYAYHSSILHYVKRNKGNHNHESFCHQEKRWIHRFLFVEEIKEISYIKGADQESWIYSSLWHINFSVLIHFSCR